MMKNKVIRMVCIGLVLCLLSATILFVVFKKDEVIRVSIERGADYYIVLYENGELVVERGVSKHQDISKKPYISKKKVEVAGYRKIDLYSRAETKIDADDVERIKTLAEDLKYVSNDTMPVYDTIRVQFYYKGRKIQRNSLYSSPSVEKLVKELVKLSPKPINLSSPGA